MARKGENIFHRIDGRWEARYVKEYDSNGRCKYGYLYGKTYLEVKNKRNKLLLKMKVNQTKVVQDDNTFTNKIHQWLDTQRISVKISTYTYYENICKKHIIPYLGTIYLTSINDKIIADFLNNKINSCELNQSTIREILVVLKQILSFYNIKVNVKIPKAVKRNITVLEQKEIVSLSNYLKEKDSSKALGILLSLYAGLRLGEVCALKWKDINIEEGIIYVHNTLERVKNTFNDCSKTVLLELPAKTNNSVRIVPISSSILNILKRYKHKFSDSYYVISSCEKFLDPRSYYNYYKRILKDCDLKDYNYHVLRHTFATNCIKLGLDAKSLSEMLGHSNVNTTLTFYVHPNLELKKDFMNNRFKFI